MQPATSEAIDNATCRLSQLHSTVLWFRSDRHVTRKHRWRNGKRATAVRVGRPLAKKFTANQRKEDPKIVSLEVTAVVYNTQ